MQLYRFIWLHYSPSSRCFAYKFAFFAYALSLMTFNEGWNVDKQKNFSYSVALFFSFNFSPFFSIRGLDICLLPFVCCDRILHIQREAITTTQLSLLSLHCPSFSLFCCFSSIHPLQTSRRERKKLGTTRKVNKIITDDKFEALNAKEMRNECGKFMKISPSKAAA